jgi:hypothetical protein
VPLRDLTRACRFPDVDGAKTESDKYLQWRKLEGGGWKQGRKVSETVLGALVGVLGTSVGVAVAFAFTIGHERVKAATSRKELAAILAIELIWQAKYIAETATRINRCLMDKPRALRAEDDLAMHLPPAPFLYQASLGKLGLLPHEASSQLVVIYNELRKTIEATKARHKIVASDEEDKSRPREMGVTKTGEQWLLGELTYIPRWAELWRGVAMEAVLALSELEKAAGDALNKRQRDHVQSTIGSLLAVRDGGEVTLPDDEFFLGLPPLEPSRHTSADGAQG